MKNLHEEFSFFLKKSLHLSLSPDVTQMHWLYIYRDVNDKGSTSGKAENQEKF